MVKYLFLILVTLLSGCTTDFSGLDKPEESVYIRFSSRADVKADIEEASYTHGRNTRGDETSEHSVGILGIATDEDLMAETTLAGCQRESLRKWMANDVYYRNPNTGDIVHEKGENPSFPIHKGSAIVAYAYMPHTAQVEFEADDCYIPIDLREDSATTDWKYSSKTAMSKAEYRSRVDSTFTLDTFKHVMTRLDLVFHLYERYRSVEILEVDLGINSGQGRLSLVNGEVTMSDDAEPMHLQRRINKELSFGGDSLHTEQYYLLPYTEIHDIRIVGVWTDPILNYKTDTVTYEYTIADSAQWNSRNLHPGACSTIHVKSLK